MKIENQVCSLEQAKKLKELGVLQDGYYCFLENSASRIEFGGINEMFEHHIHDYEISVHPNGFDGSFKEQSWIAFTVAELGVMIPYIYLNTGALHSDEHLQTYQYYFGFWKTENEWSYRFEQYDPDKFFNTQAKCYSDWLIYLLENNIVTAAEVNQRLLISDETH